MKIKIEDAKKLAETVLTKTGVVKEHREAIIDHLLQQDLMGKGTHGLFRIPSVCEAAKNIKHKKITISTLDKNIIKVNGESQLGLYVCDQATKKVADVLKTQNFCIAGVTNYAGTNGALGYYSSLLAERGITSIIMCTSEYAVAPWGGKDAILGTNPIAFGIPASPHPIIVDFATSAKTYGELMMMAQNNQQVGLGIVLDKDGNPSTNPNDANDGCQLPMAAHKGYALGLAIEILAGVFIGAKAGKDAVPGNDGMLIIAFKSSLFETNDAFAKNIQALISEIKNSSLAKGFNEILIPGEKSFKLMNQNKKDGTFELDDKTFEKLKGLL